MNLDEQTRIRLSDQLIKLGDMMGDGLHHEPDGRWITAEYKKVVRALGIGPARKNNCLAINDSMSKLIARTSCLKCGGTLKQTRSGSKHAECQSCGARFKAGKRKS